MVTLEPGSRLGPYEIIAPLGRGGMGEVWKARDQRLDRIVAIKHLKPEHAARFEREARAIAALNHPYICQIHDVGPDYLVLETSDGRPLQGPMEVAEAVRLGMQIVEALHTAHQRGILHRDLKPDNVMVSYGPGNSLTTREASNVKLLDFGLAKPVATAADVTQTHDGLVGTAAYMSPEQAQVSRSTRGRTCSVSGRTLRDD